MKYTKSDLKKYTYVEWMELIAKELNQANILNSAPRVKDGRMQWSDVPFEVNDPGTFFENINSVKAINYLKEIGLINNGRCPWCGADIYGTPDRFTDSYFPSINYHICSRCARTKGGLLPDNRGCGCLLALPLFLLKTLFMWL